MNTRKDARGQLQTLVIIGLIIGAIGGLVTALAWPGEDVSSFGGVTETGNTAVAIAGTLIAWAGNAMLFVGLVGYGVMLGREAAPPPQVDKS